MFTMKTPQNLQNPSEKPKTSKILQKPTQNLQNFSKKNPKPKKNQQKSSKLYKQSKIIDPDYLEK